MKVRAKTLDGREVVGQCLCWQGRYFIVEDADLHECGFTGGEKLMHHFAGFVEIAAKTAAVSTGKMDKNGKGIFGSVSKMGFDRGDRVHVEYISDMGHRCTGEGIVTWDELQYRWMIFVAKHIRPPLYKTDYRLAELEIIPPGEDEK
jgi:hypothetical protein